MWTLVVPVADEFSVGWIDPSFANVRLMEGFDLADRGWPSHARNDMLNPISTAELREL